MHVVFSQRKPIALLFVLIILFTIGAGLARHSASVCAISAAQEESGGHHSGCRGALRALRLRCLILALVSLLMVVGILGPSRRAAAQSANNTPIVVLRIDDARPNWRTHFLGFGGLNGLQYGEMRHIPITWGVVSCLTGSTITNSGTTFLTWPELKTYLDTAGGEAASHSVTHSALSTDAAYISELANSKAAIQQNLPGYACNTFLEPGEWAGDGYITNFTSLNNPVGLAMQANYAQSQNYLGTGWHVGPIFYNYGLCADWTIDNTTTASIPQIQATLNEVAATPGLVFVITGHGVGEKGSTPSAYTIASDYLAALMDTLDSMRNQGLIRLMSMNDAYNTALDSSLNMVPDAGFESCNPGTLNPAGPWVLTGKASIVSSGGVSNSKYAYMPDSSSWIESAQIVLNPGDYLMTWSQKSDSGVAASKNVYVTLPNIGPTGGNSPVHSLYRVAFPNSATGDWEQKSALVKSHSQMPFSTMTFTSDGGFGIDNVSITNIQLNPAVSPTQVAVNPNPTQCPVSWVTPTDPTVTSMVVRFSWSTFPQKPTDGMAYGSVAPIPGTTQSVAKSNWHWNFTYAYFSVFAVKADGSYSPPDFELIKCVTTAPPAPTASASVASTTGRASESWSDSSTVPIYQYSYANGTTSGGTDISPWTITTQTSASVNIPSTITASTAYLSVMAESVFGIWSPVTTTSFTVPPPVISQAIMAQPDGTTVIWSGIVTALFGGECYIESTDRWRGIQVRGTQTIQGLVERQQASVRGTLTTINGERVIQCN